MTEILDSTLRDGAQSEGISFSLEDKLKIIKRLDDFGVSYIEAGNPASCPKDIELFKRVASLSLKEAEPVAFGSTTRKGVSPREDENISALLAANVKTVSIFGKSHDLQVGYILKATLEENISMIRRTIEYLVKQYREVIFDAEHFFDGYKSNPGYALDTVKAAAKAGACTIVLCDTNGGCFPDEIERITAKVAEEMNAGDSLKLGIHCHDDTGCAVANTLAAVRAGAVHIQGTLNGIGERCGNANLSAVIPNLQLKLGRPCVPEGSIEKISETAQFIAQVANIRLPYNMPYVGAAAFAHKGGMHVDGVIKNAESFEHVAPEKVGNQRNVLLSEMSGRGALLVKISEILPHISQDEKENPLVKNLIQKVKKLEHEGYKFEAADASFELLVLKEAKTFRPHFEIIDYKIVSSLHGDSSAMVKIKSDGKYEISADEGEGPVNAIDRALRKALEVFYPALADMKLSDYKVRIINGAGAEDTASITRVLMESTDSKSSWTTVGASDNIISASMIALVDSIEYFLTRKI